MARSSIIIASLYVLALLSRSCTGSTTPLAPLLTARLGLGSSSQGNDHVKNFSALTPLSTKSPSLSTPSSMLKVKIGTPSVESEESDSEEDTMCATKLKPSSNGCITLALLHLHAAWLALLGVLIVAIRVPTVTRIIETCLSTVPFRREELIFTDGGVFPLLGTLTWMIHLILYIMSLELAHGWFKMKEIASVSEDAASKRV